MRIDSHQHFWKFDPIRDSWIDETMKVLQRDFMPADLAPLLIANHLQGCIAVQADQSERETTFLLDLASKNPFIKKVVGWVDFTAPDIEGRLAAWKKHPHLAGFRHILQGEPPEKMKDRAFCHGIGKLEEYGYTYDILIYPKHLDTTLEFVDTFPNQLFVIDHLAKPAIRNHELEPWRKLIRQLARRPNVFCKLSGMVTEADWKNWTSIELVPYMDTVLETFGPSRLMFGSDWPVCLLAADYGTIVNVAQQFVNQLTPTEREKIMGGTAAHFYNITN